MTHADSKFVAILGAVALILSTVTACSGSDSDAVNLWLPPNAGEGVSDKAEWDRMLVPFEEQHQVDVRVTIVPWSNYADKYLTGVASGEGPDVGYMYGEMIGDYVLNEQLEPFDEYLTQEQRENLLFLPEGQVDGKQYGMPFVVGGARVLFYNRDILAEAGIDNPPRTWEDFEQATLAIKKTGKTPFLQGWGEGSIGALNVAFFPFFWQAGGELFSEDGTKALFDSEAGIKAAEFLYSLKSELKVMPEAVTSLQSTDVNARFSEGDVGFVIASDADAGVFDEAGLDVGFVDSLKGETKGTFTAADALVMLKDCEDKQLCADLVRFMQDEQQMEQFHEFASYPPISKNEEYKADPRFKELYEQESDVLRTLPLQPNSAAAYNSLYLNLQRMMLGLKTPEEAMTDATRDADLALGRKS